MPTVLSWSRPPRTGHFTFLDEIDGLDGPRVLEPSDLDAIRAAGAPFCRKVRSPDSDTLLATLESQPSS